MRFFRQIFVATLLSLILAGASVFSQTSTWDGSAASWTQGSGTSSSPYLIESAQNLAYLAEMVNGGVSNYSGKYFKLTTNINLNSLAWTPIGDYNTTSAVFKGRFDGDNYSITNLKINSSSLNYCGLFGRTSGCSISNLSVRGEITRGANTTSNGYCGGIVGYAQSTTFNCCSNYAKVQANARASSTVQYNAYSGGLAGYATGTTTIIGCNNSGNISASWTNGSPYTYSGGLLGYATGTTNISLCNNTGNINSSSSGEHCYSGGIIGYIYTGTTSISICYNTGTIKTTSNSYAYCYSGGLVGYGTVTIANCYNRGNVTATNQDDGRTYAVGISRGTNTNCYNTGTLTGSEKSCIGGTATNCYYLQGCGGSGNGTSKTETVMKSQSFPTVLNSEVFIMDITPNVNDGYPIFGSSVCNVTTNSATNISYTSAKLNGKYTNGEQWSGTPDMQGFEYKKTSASSWTTVYVNVGTPASHNLTGLTNGTNYQCRMFVKVGDITIYGNTVEFTTTACNATVSITSGTTQICDNSSVTLTASATSSGSISSYAWSNSSTTRAITVRSAGTYKVTVTDQYGCTATASCAMTSIAAPTASISGNSYVCSGGNTTLTASGGVGYVWSTGATTPSISVSSAGTYSVIARASNNCTDTAYINITAFDDVSISGNTAICAGESTTLTVSGGSSYRWSTGATTRSITVTNEGLYSVTATSGQCSANASVYVTVNSLPNASISGNTTICGGASTTLTANGGTSYTWSNNATSQSINVLTAGTYKVTATNANGCTASVSASVVAASNPTPQITGNLTACEGEIVTLAANGGTSYSWSNGSTNASISVTSGGTYTVVASNNAGCTASTNATVTINGRPAPVISGNLSICDGESTTLSVNGGDSFVWSNGSASESINVTSSGNYSVVASNSNGCTASASVTVNVMQNPTVTISGEASICVGETANLNAEGGVSYVWSNGSHNQNINVSDAGTYSVVATGTNGCTSSTSMAVVQYSAPEVTISGNTTVCEGSNETLTASGGVSYVWSTGETSSAISVNVFGIYSVTATSNGGCTSTANVTVFVAPTPNPVINGNLHICDGEPTTLTANGGETYMWSNGSTANSIDVSNGGTYSVIATNANGCTAMASASVVAGYSVTNAITETTDDEFVWNGQTYTENGNYVQTFTAANGCDSVVTLHLTVNSVQHYNIFVISNNNAYGTTTGTGVYEANTEIQISATANDGYEFLSWNDGNTDTLRTITVTGDATYIATFIPATGIEESVALEINVFPNPATDILNITSSETISEIEIVNVMGQVVRRVEVNSDNAVCNVEDLTSGVYVVRIRTASATLSQQRFVKE